MLERLFKLQENGTTVRTEVLAGVTTFLTMAYISIVNPLILADAGMDFGAVFVATCLAAAFGTFIRGFWATYPIALAPGMGLNAYFTYTVVKTMGFTWQVGLGAVFLSGLIFLLISVLPLREQIINAIPRSLKMAISSPAVRTVNPQRWRRDDIKSRTPASSSTTRSVPSPCQ